MDFRGLVAISRKASEVLSVVMAIDGEGCLNYRVFGGCSIPTTEAWM